MPSRPRRWNPSSGSCARDELQLLPCRGLAALFGLHLVGLPVALWLSPVEHAFVAGLAAAIAGSLALPAGLRICLLRGPGAPRRLAWTAEGRFTLDLAGGRSVEVLPLGRSLVAGPWRVLMVRAGRLERLVIETRRHDPVRIASLDRALRRAATAPGAPRHGLRSLITPGGRGH